MKCLLQLLIIYHPKMYRKCQDKTQENKDIKNIS